MFKLLPQEEKKRLRKEYLLRVSIVAGLFVFGATIIGTISLLPPYVRSETKDETATKQLNHLKETSAANADPKFMAELKAAQEQIAQLSEGTNRLPLHKLISVATKDRPLGLKINSISLNRTLTGSSTLNITGIAPTRESLVAFKKTIESETVFTKVESPVSELAKSKDIGFSLAITGSF